jgi:hypothetical protein
VRTALAGSGELSKPGPEAVPVDQSLTRGVCKCLQGARMEDAGERGGHRDHGGGATGGARIRKGHRRAGLNSAELRRPSSRGELWVLRHGLDTIGLADKGEAFQRPAVPTDDEALVCHVHSRVRDLRRLKPAARAEAPSCGPSKVSLGCCGFSGVRATTQGAGQGDAPLRQGRTNVSNHSRSTTAKWSIDGRAGPGIAAWSCVASKTSRPRTL